MLKLELILPLFLPGIRIESRNPRLDNNVVINLSLISLCLILCCFLSIIFVLYQVATLMAP